MKALRSRWVVIPLLVVLLLGLAAYVALQVLHPARKAPAQLSAEMKAQAALTGPAKVYAANCAHCHAPAEGAAVAPALAGRQLPAAAVQAIVRHGVQGMPAFTPVHISDAELLALAEHVQALPAPVAQERR